MEKNHVRSTVDCQQTKATRPKSTISEQKNVDRFESSVPRCSPKTFIRSLNIPEPPQSVAEEMKKVGAQFCSAVENDEKLALLSLVDPIRAYADAGITTSRALRKYLRHAYPHFAYGNRDLYEAVRDEKLKIPWIKGIKVSQVSQVSLIKRGKGQDDAS